MKRIAFIINPISGTKKKASYPVSFKTILTLQLLSVAYILPNIRAMAEKWHNVLPMKAIMLLLQ